MPQGISHLRHAQAPNFIGGSRLNREAALAPSSLEWATPIGTEPGVGYCYGVDAGLGSVADYAATQNLPDDWNLVIEDYEISWMEQLYPGETYAPFINVPVPGAQNGESIVIAGSGWGDGCPSMVIARAPDGSIAAVHTDFDVTGPVEPLA